MWIHQKKWEKSLEKGGIEVIEGVAESLPFPDLQFDFVLMVTTLCFLDNIEIAFKEVHQVLKPSGLFIIEFIDAESPLGKLYEMHKNESTFYHQAKFYTVKQVISLLKKSPFKDLRLKQTLFKPLNQIKNVETIKEGQGKGSFIVIRGKNRIYDLKFTS